MIRGACLCPLFPFSVGACFARPQLGPHKGNAFVGRGAATKRTRIPTRMGGDLRKRSPLRRGVLRTPAGDHRSPLHSAIKKVPSAGDRRSPLHSAIRNLPSAGDRRSPLHPAIRNLPSAGDRRSFPTKPHGQIPVGASCARPRNDRRSFPTSPLFRTSPRRGPAPSGR